MNRDYQRGYYAAACSRWAPHKPPFPPEEHVRALMAAALDLRDRVDTELGKFDPDDELEKALAPGIEAVDKALAAIGEWLKRPDSAEGSR